MNLYNYERQWWKMLRGSFAYLSWSGSSSLSVVRGHIAIHRGRLFLLSSSHQKLTVTWQNYSCSSDFYQTSPCMINVCLRLYIWFVAQFTFQGGGGWDCPNLFWAVFVTFKVFCVHQNHYYNNYLLFEGIFCNGCIWDPSFLYGF